MLANVLTQRGVKMAARRARWALPALPRKARLLAEELHAGQRYGRDTKFSHVRAVHDLIELYFPDDTELQCAAFLHDAVEDAPPGVDARQMIRARCGPGVLALVEAVSDKPGATRAERKEGTLEKIAAAGWRAVAIKLADRLCNTRYSARGTGTKDAKKLAMYQKEYPEFRSVLFPASEDNPQLVPLWRALDRESQRA
jgi:(p)ppGpp synthase/HD superfamily hydrolase